ncbi:unnamed protein product, partial [Brassica rapa]
MNRGRKRKEPTLFEELRELELLEEGGMVDIPDLEVEDLIEENSLSVIVRCLNPSVHKVGGLVKALPPIWGMEDRVRGRGVGEDRAQFIFESEADLQHVLTKGPWFVNGWMVSLDQWSINPAPDFLQRIPFWIRVRGLPIHMLKKQVVETLLGPLGRVEEVELHAKNSNSLEYVRALVYVNTEEPLQFRMTARLKSGVTIPTELEYEKLLKVCFTCKKLSHDQARCPLQVQVVQEERRGIKGSSKELNLRQKLLDKESRAREALQKRAVRTEKGTNARNPPTSNQQGRGKNKSQEIDREEKRRGKRVVSTPTLVWKQKDDRGVSRVSRSTEESSVHHKSSEEASGRKSPRVASGEKGSSEEATETGSVFKRLGSSARGQDSGGSRERSASKGSGGDLREKLSGGSQVDGREGKLSKGSRSPPNIFERLEGPLFTTPKIDRPAEGSRSTKRRRQHSSEDRQAKKAKKGSQDKKKASPLVFLRLGGT